MNRRNWLWLLVAAIAFDLGIRRGVLNGASTAAMLLTIAAAVGASGLVRRQTGYALLAGSIPFSLLLALRSDPRLTAFNLIAALGLIGLAASHQTDRSLFDYRPGTLVSDVVEYVTLALAGPFMALGDVAPKAWSSTAGRNGRVVIDSVIGVLIAVPIVLVLGTLLSSADPVFVALLTAAPFDFGSFVGHLALVVIGAILVGVVLQLAGRDERAFDCPTVEGRLARRQVDIVLGSVGALFGLFAIAQLLAVLGVSEGALDAAGSSFRDYARQGFFQLLWVAAITLAVLVTLRVLTDPAQRYARSTVRLNWAVVGLTILIAVVAIVRLNLYIGDDGLTPLRFYSMAFIFWIIVAHLLASVRLSGRWRDYQWLSTALVGSGLVFLLGLNVINPEAVIANENMDNRPNAILWKLDRLSPEGWQVVVERSDELEPIERITVADELCGFELERSPLDWNRSLSRAEDSLAKICR